jgi:multidrug efflux pump subunit AcrB
LAGKKDFLLNRDADQTASEAEIYIKTVDTDAVERIKKDVQAWIDKAHPMASVSFQPPENIFEAIFSEDKPEIVAQLSDLRSKQVPELGVLYDFIEESENQDNLLFESIPVDDQLVIEVDPELLLLYNVDFNSVYYQLKSAFNQRQIGLLKTYQRFIPIMMGENQRTVLSIIQETLIKNREGVELPLASLVKMSKEQNYKSIKAGKEGEYVPMVVRNLDGNHKSVIDKIKKRVRDGGQMEAVFQGTFFSQKELIREMGLVLLVSVMLLYFILAAQFESFMQPLIVLLELPIDIAGAFFLLYLFGESLNIMSAIGIIVMSGIIINDSILKIDTINRARWNGADVLDAIKIGGKRRLKPILMTSLTTILALTPFLFFKGLGAELQRPLAIAVIGGMTIGTAVSLYFIPLAYWVIYHKRRLTA